GTNINFNLRSGNGRYGKLLGFDIELADVQSLPGGQERWSGALVNLPPVDAKAFGIASGTKIPFSNLIIVGFENNQAVPKDNIVKTDITELSFKLFGYLPVKLSNGDGQVIVVEGGLSFGDGKIGGRPVINVDAIQGYRGGAGLNGNVPLSV